MKGFQKLALVTAIAAAPFAAQAEMTAIDDSMLSEMTGQAGVTIELSAQVSIGGIEYTDTDGHVSSSNSDAASGTVGINNVVLGGAAGGALDDLKIDIDVDGNDGLIIHLGGTDMAGVLADKGSVDSNPVDFGLAIGSVDVNSQAVLMSNLSIQGNLGPADITISNASVIGVDAYFEITAGSMNVDVLGVGISGLTVGQNNDAFLRNQDTGLLGGGAASGVTLAQAAAGAGAAATITDTDGDLLDDTSGLTLAETQAATEAGTIASVVGTFETTYGNGLSDMAHVAMTVQTADTAYIDKAGTSTAVTDALSVSIDSMSMDIAISSITVGGSDIGSLAINDLDLSGTSLKIYGH